MKKFIYFGVVAVVAIICSGCADKSNRIEYLPCKVEKNEDWGFVDAKGNVCCRDAFRNCPSVVRDGVFFVEEGDYYSLYKFDPQKPVLLAEDIVYKGRPRNGIFPLCKKDCHIEVYDNKGNSLFTLETIEGREVVGCAAGYTKYGYLPVITMDDEGKQYVGVVDNKGNVVIKPKYNELVTIAKDLFYVIVESNDEEEGFFINKKGEKQSQWKELEFCEAMEDASGSGDLEYVCAKRDDRCYIYNLDGEELLRCPEKVKDIIDIKGDYFVFEGANGYGVMNLDGEKFLTDKYKEISMLPDNRYLVRKDAGHNYELLDKDGITIKDFDDFDDGVAYLKEFGNIAGDNNYFYILDDDFNAYNMEIYNINYPGLRQIQSEYFDYNAAVNSVKSYIQNGLRDMNLNFGTSANLISAVTAKGVDYYGSYQYRVTLSLVEKYNFELEVEAYFDDHIVEPIYKTETVREYSYWYGYYNTTKNVLKGYKFNSSAELTGLELSCDVPYAKKDKLHNELADMLASLATASNEGKNTYRIGNFIYTLDGVDISIDLAD